MSKTKSDLLQEVKDLKADRKVQQDEIDFLRRLVEKLANKIAIPAITPPVVTPTWPMPYIGDPPYEQRPIITCESPGGTISVEVDKSFIAHN
mgnify:CR=1 FL=1|tara:strand:+ start:31498 stop:31773 length:276 start_codon:yes stop_codon:yes gene_type:complete